MYIPNEFEINDRNEIINFIKENTINAAMKKKRRNKGMDLGDFN